MILEKVYDELMAQIEDLKKAMGGGSDDYDDLRNRPKVNNITLTGNKKSSDLKIVYSMTEAEYAAATKNAESIYCLQENATTFEEEDETASSYIEWSVGDPSGYVATWAYTPSNQNFTGCTAVECDDAAITVEGFVVAEGEVQVFLSCDDTTQIGETVTFTYNLTQSAGETRIVKNGVEFAKPPLTNYDFTTKTETAVGKWVDGSTIYRKVFDLTTQLTGSDWTNLVSATGMVKLIDGLAVGIDRYGGNVPAFTRGFLMRIYNGNVQIALNATWQFTVDEFILYYTK